ncbi:hypothetical protein ABTW36_13720 [Morganella morganii]|uniref:hypothetical protein n=1 Tax=Morganella morganii TaxID=582 RepID=UPI0033145D3A
MNKTKGCLIANFATVPPSQLTEFNLDGYRFDESQSGERELVFTRPEGTGSDNG